MPTGNNELIVALSGSSCCSYLGMRLEIHLTVHIWIFVPRWFGGHSTTFPTNSLALILSSTILEEIIFEIGRNSSLKRDI